MLDWVGKAGILEKHYAGGFACAILVPIVMYAVPDVALEIGWTFVEAASQELDLHMQQMLRHAPHGFVTLFHLT